MFVHQYANRNNMRPVTLLLHFIALLFALPSMAQTRFPYEKEWAAVDSLTVQKGLPRSALAIVDRIYAAAKREGNQAEVVRALVYRAALPAQTREDNLQLSIASLEKETATAPQPAASLLQSITASLYWQYLQQHRWELYNRTATREVASTDMTTWSLADLHQKITSLYLASLKPAALLKATPLGRYEPILLKGNKRALRPTLYDLLAFEAIQYFRNGEYELRQAERVVRIDDPAAFAPAPTFAKARFPRADTLAPTTATLLLLQDLIAFHLADPQPEALIDLDIERLVYVHAHWSGEDKVKRYRDALQQLLDHYGDRLASQAAFRIAAADDQAASTYRPFGDTSTRFLRIRARDLLRRIVADSTLKNEGWTNSINLLKQVELPSFSFSIEKVNVPAEPFRALVTYKETPAIHFRILKASEEAKRQLSGYDPYWKKLSALAPVRQWSQALPPTNDLQEHSVEIKIDALPAGAYILYASRNGDFSAEGNQFAAQVFTVSRISYATRGRNLFVLDRSTGKPLSNAAVDVLKRDYSTRSANQVKSIGSYRTDANGHIALPGKKENDNALLFDIRYDDDRLALNDETYIYRTNSDEDEEEEEEAHMFFFTDRAIYRPGQTVFFKGIVLKKKSRTIAAGFKTTIFLENANSEAIDSLKLTTNDYGSFNGRFTLPQGGLAGSYRLYDEDDENSIGFSVEEYKRPRFSISFDQLTTSYRVGDSIRLAGMAKAYAGNAVDGAAVSYRVTRSARFPYVYGRFGWWPTPAPAEIAHGEVKTDRTGRYTITFKASPDSSVNRLADPIFEYSVHVDITDINGETRSADEVVRAGYKSLLLSLSEPRRVPVGDSLRSLQVLTQNNAGTFLPARLSTTVTQLMRENRLIRRRYWQRPDQFVMDAATYKSIFPHDEYDNETDPTQWTRGGRLVQADTASATGSFVLRSALAPGWYEVNVTATAANGETVTDTRQVEVYDTASGFTGAPYLWYAPKQIAVQPGQDAQVQIGSAADNVFLVQLTDRVTTGNEHKESFTYGTLNREKKTVAYHVTETDRGGFGISFFFVKDNRFYTVSEVVNVPWSNKELQVSYATFRDKTDPGSRETWTVNVKGAKADRAGAEVLASMYDASLDQFQLHQWLQPRPWPVFSTGEDWLAYQNFSQVQAQRRLVDETSYLGYDKRYDQLMKPSILFSSLQSQVRRKGAPGAAPAPVMLEEGLQGKVSGVTVSASAVSIRGNSTISGSNRPLYVIDGVLSSTPVDPGDIASMDVLKGDQATALYGAQAANGVIVITTKSGSHKSADPVKVRTNLSELAFFYPDLRTDSAGSVQFSFTAPEALTRWKLQTLAHTRDLSFGLDAREMVTRKELMIQPNAPRFLRQGDHLEFTTKIVNLSDREMTGQVQLELIDAATNQSVDGWFQNIFPNQYFTVAAGQSELVKFPMEVPFQFSSALKWRLVARAASFSDGEESVLPVLSSQVLVTETLPLSLPGSGTRSFTFEKLLQSAGSETRQNKSLTVEYTANPAWLAVQALPSLLEVKNENAEQLWNRFYAQSVATRILASSPKIRAVIDAWRSTDTAALLSSLQKNSELRSALLEETPWVLEAGSETAQKKNLALLIDAARLSRELPGSIAKLASLQLSNGAFPWFPGGPEDRFITQYIVSGIGHLKRLGALPAETQEAIRPLLSKALAFLDRVVVDDYSRLLTSKANLKIQVADASQIQYLYARSFFTDAVPAATRPAYAYYRERAAHDWLRQTPMIQGMTALLLHRSGDSRTAADILRSLKETAVIDKEQGMYWKANAAGRSWLWHAAPVESQALLIEAFSEIAGDTRTVNELKTWLLKNKQARSWPTSKATADACYALLLQGNNWLATDPQVTVQLGAQSFRNTGAEAGTGYFKKTISAEAIQPDMGRVTVSVAPAKTENNQVSAPSYGAVYWQYFEDLDKVTAATSPLSVNRRIFLTTNTDKGPLLVPVTEGAALHVGDKLTIRLEIRTDRDMDYVHLKDVRSSPMEPVSVLSGYRWKGGLGFYQTTGDVSTNFFFDHLRRGSFVLDYQVFVTHIGTFTNGLATLQSFYAPEFAAHSSGLKLTVE
ncbi:MAG: alpha-2-macroglobulin [Flaviaesturariibacter sp.]|nr:alpha-2-macroglobulin [Flaviaesturariibacter sp.]